MNIKKKCPFEAAKIEILKLQNLDVITVSPGSNTGLPFEGEEEEFGYYWDQN